MTLSKKEASKYEKALETKEILEGTVKVVQKDETLDTDVLILDLNGTKGMILRDEIDLHVDFKSLINFVGRDILFVVKEVDVENGVVICSRKEAQAIKEEAIIPALKEGEKFTAEIINILPYGAYVDIEGVTGLLKNIDFAEDYTTLRDVKKIGDKVEVVLKKESENGRLIFEATKKFQAPTIMDASMFEPNQVVLGVIRNIKPFGAFVRIAPSLDALCSIPPVGEYEEGMSVQFRITKIVEDENGQKRVRGKIVKAIH